VTDRPNHPAKEPARRAGNVFISSAPADKNVAQELARGLRARGLSTWLEIENLQPGAAASEALRAAIEEADLCLVLVGKKTNPNSAWLSKEWATIQDAAWRRSDLAICPVLLDDVAPPAFLRRWRELRLPRKNRNIAEAVDGIVEMLAQDPTERAVGVSEADLSETTARFSEMISTLTEVQKATDTE
jgi:hypothetical protein